MECGAWGMSTGGASVSSTTSMTGTGPGRKAPGRTARAIAAPSAALLLVTGVSASTAVAVGLPGVAAAAPTSGAVSQDLQQYLDLPLVNRDAAHGPGGVNPALPYDEQRLGALLDQARAAGVEPTRYAALLYQYWLVDVSNAAGIDLAQWDPRAGAEANRQNLIDSYKYYEKLQLQHRELQWAGMGGLVGGDFGGGLLDFELLTDVYEYPGLSQAANEVVSRVLQAGGAEAAAQLPDGLRALAEVGATVTPQDLHWVLGMILVMQKNIFSDLMPMHQAYVTEGLPALEEMQRAGLFGADIMQAWRDVASGDPGRIAAGNGALLRREQYTVIAEQWDQVRDYKGAVGEAITYATTIAATPSVAGVVPPREFHPIEITRPLPDGRTVTITTPLPGWNWSVFDERWEYINAQLLPKYKAMVENDWPGLAAQLSRPYADQLRRGRPLQHIPELLSSAAAATKVTVS